MNTKEQKLAAFGRLLDVLDELREKCPWDRKQTNESLRPNTIEETFELCDALLNDDTKNICKELGDVLLHVAFYAKIAQEREQFDIADVCNALCDKLIYRHPHVFTAGNALGTPEEVCAQWEQLKQKERDGNKSVLSGVPSSLPSLIKAYRIQEKAANVGFEWDDATGAWEKLKEEIAEYEREMKGMNKEKAQAELGDVIFSLVNVARMSGLNPDTALERSNAKFISRFSHIETRARENGAELKNMTLEEMDALWDEAKKLENIC